MELVKLECTAGQTGYTFNDQPVLRSTDDYQVEVTSIEAYNASQVTSGPEGETIVAAAAFNSAFLTVQNENEDQLDVVPLYALNPSNFNGRVRQVSLKKIAWQKSKVNFASNLGDTSTVILLVTYKRRYRN